LRFLFFLGETILLEHLHVHEGSPVVETWLWPGKSKPVVYEVVKLPYCLSFALIGCASTLIPFPYEVRPRHSGVKAKQGQLFKKKIVPKIFRGTVRWTIPPTTAHL